jgi:hypothetical protein
MLLQPYCNRAGTGTYALDKQQRCDPLKTWKIAQFSDAVVQARTYLIALAWRRSGVQVPSGPLHFS